MDRLNCSNKSSNERKRKMIRKGSVCHLTRKCLSDNIIENGLLRFFIVFFLLGISAHHVVSQTKDNVRFRTKITYTVTYLGDSSDTDTKRSEEMVLLVNDNHSLFESRNSNISDSLKFISSDGKQGNITRNTYSYFVYKIFKDYEKNRITTFDTTLPSRNEPGSKGFQYREGINNINWELAEQTDTIGDMVCQIAYTNFGNRNWKAYFNPEIPISDGPYKFSGLPGLIVRIVDEKEHWDFTLSSIESGQSSSQPFFATLEPVSDYPDIKKEKFLKEKRFAEDNFIQIQEAMRGRPSDPDRRKQIYDRFRESLRVRSNWIEPYL